MKGSIATLAALMLFGTLYVGCERETKIIAVSEDPAKATNIYRPSENSLREDFEDRMKAREQLPEPELNPDDPREKFANVWTLGRNRLGSIYEERAQMIAMLERVKLDEPEEKKLVKPWIPKLTAFGIGREVTYMEQAPGDICKLIEEIRVPSEKLIVDGRAELEKIEATLKELDAHADAGGTVYQQQWDKLEDSRKRWSAPVRAGKQMLLVVKSILEEAYVLAEHGPRRSQIALRDCLTPISEKPLALDLAQEQLEKVVKRSRWYR